MSLTIKCLPDYILISGNGLSSLIEAQQHFRDLSAVLVRERKRERRARVLVDLREGTPQMPEVVTHINKAMSAIYRATDRVAIIAPSALAKAQIQQSRTHDTAGVFVSQFAAEQYLLGQRGLPTADRLTYEHATDRVATPPNDRLIDERTDASTIHYSRR